MSTALVAVPRAAGAASPRAPGYGRAFGRVAVFGGRAGGAVALAGALVRAYAPGTAVPWALPLYGDEASEEALVFPLALGDDGGVALWADAPARVELLVEAPGYLPERAVLDLEPPPDATPGVDAYTKSESDARYPSKTDADPYPVYATDAGLAAVQAQLAAVYTEAEADARFERLTRKGAADGYAPLDAGGLVPTAHLPPLAIDEVFVVASQAAMLALDAQVGDMAVRTDSGLTYVLAAEPASVLASWKEVLAAGQVQSVNGETGVVSLSAADVGAAAADHTHPSTASEQWRFQNNPTVGDPGDGYLRSNTGVLSTATVLSLSRTTQDGYDVPPSGFGVVAGDTVYVQDRNDNARWVRYTANEPLARFATYVTGSVTVTGSAGSIAHGQIVQVTFSLAGGGGGGGGGLATDPLADAKGDLFAASADNAIGRLPLGTNGQVLTADSAQTLGVRWAAAGGAPSDATYVTLAAEAGLSGETALGAGVIMSGLLSARPAAATAGRLYLATDTDLVYRDTGSAWETFATRTTASPRITVASSAPSSPATGDLWVW